MRNVLSGNEFLKNNFVNQKLVRVKAIFIITIGIILKNNG